MSMFFVVVTCFSVSSKTLPDSALSITCRVFRYVHKYDHKTSILIRTSLFSLLHSKSSGGMYLIIPAKRFCHLQISRLLARDLEESFKALCSMTVSSCVVSIPPRRFGNVFGLRGFYDTARIFKRPIHNEVVLPFDCVSSVPRSEQVKLSAINCSSSGFSTWVQPASLV